MPAARSFHVSHQWLQELRDRGQLRAAAIHFRLPESEPVWAGHYRDCHEEITAKQALEWFLLEKRPQGFEVIVPRRISADEIYRVHHLARVLPLDRVFGANQSTRLKTGNHALA